jgi:hypothetical protein
MRTYRGGRGCSTPGVGMRYVDSRNERDFAVRVVVVVVVRGEGGV